MVTKGLNHKPSPYRSHIGLMGKVYPVKLRHFHSPKPRLHLPELQQAAQNAGTDYHPSDSRKVVRRRTEIERKVEGNGKAMVRKWGERENTGAKRPPEMWVWGEVRS